MRLAQTSCSIMNSSVNTSVANFLTIKANQEHGNFGNLTFLPFNAALGVIVINPNVTNVSVLSPAIGDLFAEDIFSIPQACAYPISGTRDDSCFRFFYMTADRYIAGQYGFLNRLLYYCLILFAVFAASNSWLCWVCIFQICSPRTLSSLDSPDLRGRYYPRLHCLSSCALKSAMLTS